MATVKNIIHSNTALISFPDCLNCSATTQKCAENFCVAIECCLVLMSIFQAVLVGRFANFPCLLKVSVWETADFPGWGFSLC